MRASAPEVSPDSAPPVVEGNGLVQQLKDVTVNAFGGYHDYPVGEGILVDRQALTEEKFAQKLKGKAYGGLVGKLGNQQITMPEYGGDTPVFGPENLENIADDYRKIGTKEGDDSYETWKAGTIDAITQDATFPSEAAKASKERTLGKLLDDIKEKKFFDTPESTEKLIDAVEDYRSAREQVEGEKERYGTNPRIKRYGVNVVKGVKDTLALPGTLAANVHARIASRAATADPEKMAKSRGILKTVGLIATSAWLGWRAAKGLGADEFVEGFLPWGSEGMDQAKAAGVTAAVTNLESGKPSPASSASPLESPSASSISSPSASSSATESSSPSTSASSSASPEAITPGEDDVPNKRPTAQLKEDDNEITPANPVVFESDLGKFERDESGKYWKGTLEWKMREAAEMQGLDLTDRQIGVATHRMMDELGINYDEARKMPDNYHIKLNQEQLDKYFAGLGEVDHDTDSGTDQETKTEDKKDSSKETELSKEDQARLDAERRKLLGEDQGLEPEKTEADQRLEMERRKLENDPTFAVTPETTVTPGAVVRPETQPETPGVNVPLAGAAAVAAAGVATAAGVTIARNRKRKAGRPVEADDEIDDEDEAKPLVKPSS